MEDTDFMMNFLYDALVNEHRKVLFISLQNRAQNIILKLLSVMTKINLSDLSSGISDESWRRIIREAEQLKNMDLILCDRTDFKSIDDIKSACEESVKKRETEIIIIDCMQ